MRVPAVDWLDALAGVDCVPAGLGAAGAGGVGPAPPPLLIATDRASVCICGSVCDAVLASGVCESALRRVPCDGFYKQIPKFYHEAFLSITKAIMLKVGSMDLTTGRYCVSYRAERVGARNGNQLCHNNIH